MSFFSVNPLTLRNVNLSDPNAARKFEGDLAQLLFELTQLLSNPQSLSSIVNIGAFSHLNVTVVNGSTDCTGAAIITGNLSPSSSSTTTLNNVGDGSILDFRIVGSGSAVYKVAANKPGGGAYSVVALAALSGTETDMTATGIGFGVGAAAIYLRGVAQLSTGVIILGYI